MKTLLSLSTLSMVLLPSLVHAHPGHEYDSFAAGLAHPVMGIDHLIMLVAFGLLVGCSSATIRKKVTLSVFAVVSLVVGMLVGQSLGYVTLVEPIILASLFVSSFFLWQVSRLSKSTLNGAVAVSVGLVFFHGYAHGVEVVGSLLPFSVGMSCAAVALITLGCIGGHWLQSKWVSLGVAAASSLFLLVS